MLYAFDVLVRRGENLTQQALSKRREILESIVTLESLSGIRLLRPSEDVQRRSQHRRA